jgi:hypothetical protein
MYYYPSVFHVTTFKNDLTKILYAFLLSPDTAKYPFRGNLLEFTARKLLIWLYSYNCYWETVCYEQWFVRMWKEVVVDCFTVLISTPKDSTEVLKHYN